MNSDQRHRDVSQAPAGQKPDLADIFDRVNEAAESFESLTSRLNDIADSIYGARPPHGIEGEAKVREGGYVASLRSSADRLELSLKSLSEAVQRFAPLV